MIILWDIIGLCAAVSDDLRRRSMTQIAASEPSRRSKKALWSPAHELEAQSKPTLDSVDVDAAAGKHGSILSGKQGHLTVYPGGAIEPPTKWGGNFFGFWRQQKKIAKLAVMQCCDFTALRTT